jgi:hypothetical protein
MTTYRLTCTCNICSNWNYWRCAVVEFGWTLRLNGNYESLIGYSKYMDKARKFKWCTSQGAKPICFIRHFCMWLSRSPNVMTWWTLNGHCALLMFCCKNCEIILNWIMNDASMATTAWKIYTNTVFWQYFKPGFCKPNLYWSQTSSYNIFLISDKDISLIQTPL